MRTIKSELKRVGLAEEKEKSRKRRFVRSTEQQNEAQKREIEELMGIRRPTYRKHRGAFRSK